MDLKTFLDDSTGPWLLRPLARIAPWVTVALIGFALVSLVCNGLYYLGSGWRDTFTVREVPDGLAGLVISKPIIMHNQSETYDLIIANDPGAQPTDPLVVRVTDVQMATLLPESTTIFTFSNKRYEAVRLKLRNEPAALSASLARMPADLVQLRWPGEPDALVMLTVDPEPLVVSVPREWPLAAVFRQLFVIDSFNTAALGIGVVLVLLQRLTSARRELLVRWEAEALSRLRARYRSGETSFEGLCRAIDEHMERYGSLLKRAEPRRTALESLRDPDPEVHLKAISQAIPPKTPSVNDGTSANVGRQTSGAGGTAAEDHGAAAGATFLEEHVAWFLYYDREWSREKEELLKGADSLPARMTDQRLRRELVRQMRLQDARIYRKTKRERDSTSAQDEGAGMWPDPVFPQDHVREQFCRGTSEKERSVIIVGQPGSGKSELLKLYSREVEAYLAGEAEFGLVVTLGAAACTDMQSLLRQIGDQIATQLRERFDQEPYLWNELVGEYDQERLLASMGALDQGASPASPDELQRLKLLGHSFKQLLYANIVILIDDLAPHLRIDILRLMLQTALPQQKIRLCCAYNGYPPDWDRVRPERCVHLEWTGRSSDLQTPQLSEVLDSHFFWTRQPGSAKHALVRYKIYELLPNISGARERILGSSYTPRDLTIWREAIEAHIVDENDAQIAQCWGRLWDAMVTARDARRGRVGWRREDLDQVGHALVGSAGGSAA